MKALVIGAGVCGPATAMALQRAGVDAVVYEAHDRASADAGSYLTVATNGLDALRAIDAHGPVLQAGFPTPWTTLFSGTGRRLGTLPIGSTRGERDASRTIKRAHLHRALHQETARRGVPIEFGKRLASVEVTATDVRGHFDDGSQATGDLLIGCDGVHSATRIIIDPQAPSPRYVGLLNFGGYTAGTALGETGAWHMIFGARAFFGYVPDAAGGTAWFANVPRHQATRVERESTTAAQWKRWLIELFANDRGPATALIEAGDLELAADNTHDLPSVSAWHKGRLIVIGDAAHAPSPSSGQGASMALEDAVILSKCLRDLPSVPMAFAAFERVRRRRAERIVQGTKQQQQSRRPRGPNPARPRAAVCVPASRQGAVAGVDVRPPHRLEQSRPLRAGFQFISSVIGASASFAAAGAVTGYVVAAVLPGAWSLEPGACGPFWRGSPHSRAISSYERRRSSRP